MQTIVVLMSLASSCCGGHDFNLRELLKIVSRGNPNDLDELGDQLQGGMNFQASLHPNLDNSLFCALGGGRQRGAREAREEDYPWLARVTHAAGGSGPLLCTAAAIKEHVFITAARCIVTSKCTYVTVIYQKNELKCDAFVFPQNISKQWFEDLALISVGDRLPRWPLLPRLPAPRPPEPGFRWLDRWPLYEPTNTVVGYVADPQQPSSHKLYALRNVYVGNSLCNTIMRSDRRTDDYYVPCYHPCTPEQHSANSAACDRYLAGLGHAVLDKSDTLVGMATWTCKNDATVSGRALPVGIAVPNSPNLVKQNICADRINEARARFPDTYIGLC